MSEKIVARGLSFDDVLLLQQVSNVTSRYHPDMNLSTLVAQGGPEINIPIVSANMDTVTEWAMAVAMAQYGGLGVIHRFMSASQQAEQIRIVKSQMTIMEREPITISANATVEEARQFLLKNQRGYVLVVPSDGLAGQFLGIATQRDFNYGDPHDLVTSVMTGKDNLYYVPEGTSQPEAVALMKKLRIEKIPVVRSDGTLSGIYTLKDDRLMEEFPNAATDQHGRLLVAGAIGVKEGDVERAHQLVAAGVDFLVLDVAHGALSSVATMLNRLKGHEGIVTPIIAGNVSTEETTHFLIESGADGAKIGVGPGFVCDTRDVAGTGMPQITAIMQARQAVAKSGSPIPLMGDGGQRKPGDVPKAIGAGADSVMIGSLFAGTAESPGEVVQVDGHQQKMVRGMASSDARLKQQQIEGQDKIQDRLPEGNTKFVPIQGSVQQKLFALEAGLRSGMSYTGAFSIAQMKEMARFVEVSMAGANEQRRQLR